MFRSGLSKLILGAVIVASPAQAAAPLRFCDVCAGFTISKRGDDVLIRCPGEPLDRPWMTIKDCRNPSAKRTGNNVSIVCGK